MNDKPMKMDVPRPIYEWLLEVRAELVLLKKRPVTFPETWEHVKAEYERLHEIIEAERAAR